VSADRLRPFWDFTDLDASERRLRLALDAEANAVGRAEVLTQLARVEGLRRSFGEANRLLAEAEALGGAADVVRSRVLLERGRVLRLSGDLAAALPLFEQAFETARDAGEDFIAADAAHMAALAGDMALWTERGLELARSAPDAAPWSGTLLNNLGWWRAERLEHEESLAAYRAALEAREREPEAGERPYLREAARCGVAKALLALGRAEEAVPLLEQAVEWSRRTDSPDRGFHELLAAAYAAVGRKDEADEQSRLSLVAGPGPLAQWQSGSRPPPPRSDPGS
jgi:tetratricopeptide (TPR) repeat protein